jgi:serine/threonine protein kinase
MRDIVDGRYRIEHKLAAGGFGAIYQATDLQIGRQVALKVLHRELAGDGNIVARFRREAAALAKLKSPHTLTLYDVGEDDQTLYLVMELLRGESLQDEYDRAGPLSWRRMAAIARGVCNSLREAHDAGIVHRDLKPANIVLENHAMQADFVKVLDFGIAKILDTSELYNADLTIQGQMIGTFDYMAPEQMIGGATTTQTDVFTLGVVLYEMLSGTRPFGEPKGPATMLMALLSTTPEPLVGIPPALARIIMRCISREPEERPSIVELDDILAGVLELPATLYVDDDEDDTTLVEERSPEEPPAPVRKNVRTTLVRGSAQPLHIGGNLSRDVKVAPVAYEPALEALIAPVAVRFHPTTTPEPPRARLASGTSPIIHDEPDLPAPAHGSPLRAAARWIAIAAGLVGAGFLGAIMVSAVVG